MTDTMRGHGLLDTWAGEPDGVMKVANTIFEAEDVFLRAYYEREIEGGTKYTIQIALAICIVQ